MAMTHRAQYNRPTRNKTATTQYGIVIDKQHFARVISTPEQEAHILAHYGKRPLRIIGQEVGLNTRQSRVVMERMKRDGRIKAGPGLDWRKSMQAHGYDTRGTNAPPGWISDPKRTQPVTIAPSAPSQPFCPDGTPHHRACGPLVERMIPGYYDTHARPEHGQEHQVCVRCQDVLTVRLWWARGEDVEVCEVA